MISRGFALVKRGKNHVTKLGETTTISCPQRFNHGNENPSQGAPKEHEPDFDFKAPRAQGGKGLLSHEISLQTLHKSMPLILEKIGEEEEHREKRGAGGAWLGFHVFCPAPSARKRAPPFCASQQGPRTHSFSPFASPPSLSLKTTLPLSASNKLEGP